MTAFNSIAQNHEQNAKEYFNQYLNNKDQFRLIARSLPTLEQCKTVFKDEYASIYFNFVSKIHEQINAEIEKIDYEEHVDCTIDLINTNDLKPGNNSYTGGMDEYMHVFNPNVIFYRLTYLFEDNSQSHDSIYKYFVNIDGDWLFFANPGIVFRK